MSVIGEIPDIVGLVVGWFPPAHHRPQLIKLSSCGPADVAEASASLLVFSALVGEPEALGWLTLLPAWLHKELERAKLINTAMKSVRYPRLLLLIMNRAVPGRIVDSQSSILVRGRNTS